MLTDKEIEHIMDILDPDDIGVLNPVSDEWIDWAYKEIFGGKKHSPEIFLLHLLDLSIQLYRFFTGERGILVHRFERIALIAFDAARFDDPWAIKQAYDLLYQENLIKMDGLVESMASLSRLDRYYITFKGEDRLKEVFGDVIPPPIEDPECLEEESDEQDDLEHYIAVKPEQDRSTSTIREDSISASVERQGMELEYDDVWTILDINGPLLGEVEAVLSRRPEIFAWIKNELASYQSLIGHEDSEVVEQCDNRSRGQEGLHKGCYFYAATVRGSTCERYPIKTIAEFVVFFTQQQYPLYGCTGLVFSTNDLLLYLLRIFRVAALLHKWTPGYSPSISSVLGNAFNLLYKAKILTALPEAYGDLSFDVSGLWNDLLTKAAMNNYINQEQTSLTLKGEVFLSENNTPSPPSTNDLKSQNHEESLTPPPKSIDLKNAEKVIFTPEPQKRRAGRPRRSPEKKAKEMLLHQGWIQFRESKAGGIKEYVEDLNSKGESYTVDEMKRLINRCGKDAKQ